jgi:3-oxoacyl-(acyl-carrier-protein) synthase
METLEWCWRERFEYGTLDPGTFSTYRRFPERAAEELGAAGGVVTLSLSCASGAAAIALGRTWIREGRCERVLAIGYDTLTEYCWCGLTNLRTITTDRLRPFDRDRAGTIFSEGAAAVLLEAESRRRRPALARVAGAAVNNNAFHMTAPAPDADGSRRVMQAALTDAGLEPGSVDHVCAHATGTTANDVTEVAALRNLLGPRLEEVTVAAHKSQLGHMMGGAGAAETIVSVMVLREGRIPPTVNHRNPDPECGVDCVPDRARESRVRCILTNSAGIGGNNAALVLVRGGDVDGGDAG